MAGAYIGVDGVARTVTGGYVGVDGVARSIKKAYIGDENGVAQLAWESVQLITFYVDDMGDGTIDYVCKAPADVSMTWAEWCDSEYNTYGFFYFPSHVEVYVYHSIFNEIEGTNRVLPTDVIVADKLYYAYYDD